MGRLAYGCRGLCWSWGVWGRQLAGVVVAVGREFVAACNPSILSFFLTFCTQPDLVIMTQQDSLLDRGSVGGLWVSL